MSTEFLKQATAANVLFHGTLASHIDSIQVGFDLKKAALRGDLSEIQALYFTPSRAYALAWAMYKMVRVFGLLAKSAR